MADETVTVGIDMVDGVSVPAESAASALAKLQDSIKADTKALADMQRTMATLQKATKPDTEQIQRLEKAMGQLKERVAGSRSKFIDLGGQFGRNYRESNRFKQKLDELAKAASIIPGPFGNVLSLLQRLAGAKSLARVAAIALAGAIVAIGIATVVAGKSLADFAIKAQEARRSELLMLEASTKLRTATALAFGLSADKATDLQKAVDEVAGSVSIGRDKVAAYAAQLERMGVRGAKIKPALEAVSIAASGFGEEQANNTAAWAASLALTGGNINKLAQRVKNQIGGVVAKQMLSSEVQARKLAESYNALFAGIDIEPLLRARKSFNDLFSQATASGQTLRRFLGYLVQPLVNGLELLSRVFKIVVQEIIIGALLAENAWLKFQIGIESATGEVRKDFQAVESTITATWRGIEDVLTKGVAFVSDHFDEFAAVIGGISLKLAVQFAPAAWAATVALYQQAAAATAAGLAASRDLAVGVWKAIPALLAAGVQAAATGIAFLVGLLPGIWAAITGFATMAVGVIAATWPFLAAIAAVWLLIKAFKYLSEWFSTVDWGQVGIAIIDGVVNGLTTAKNAFVNAIKGLAEVGIKAFTSIFKIGSPSKLFEGFGGDITAGLTMGVEDGAPEAQAAMEGLAPGSTPFAGLAAGVGAASGGSTINIAALNVQVGGGASKADATGIAEAIKRELESILETVTVQMGAPVP